MLLLAPRLPLATCGLVIASPAGWLLGHATTLDHWDLPKGKREPGEALRDAALRECLEETGLDLQAHREDLEDLGTRVYNWKRGKTLHLFRLTLPTPLDLKACFSSTWVTTRGPTPVLDMDAWAWVPVDQVAAHVNARMAKHLRRRGLLPSPEAASVEPAQGT